MKDEFALRNLGNNENIILDKPTMTLGRQDDCDIVLQTEESSRRHARLDIAAGEMTLEDLNSTNGTFLNNRQVHKVKVVKGGDIISIGDQSYLVLTPSCTGDNTLFGARVDREDSSYVMDKGSADQTSIRMAYPTPPGWSANDQKKFSQGGSARDEQALTELLGSRSISSSTAAAAFMVTQGKHKGSLYVLSHAASNTQWTIGRSSDCDITVDDFTVSSAHGILFLEDGEWSIEDSDSTNGIKINDTRTKSSRLKRGDRVLLGGIEMLFRPL